MADKINLARIKKFGKNFEISIIPELALKFKKGEIQDVRETLNSEQIFSNAKKGEPASTKNLQDIFQTTDPLEVAKIILKEGEIQHTAEQRSQERNQKYNKLVEMIRKQAVDPKTDLPHPATRIEAALEEAKVNLDYNKPLGEQFAEIITKIRPILPLKVEQKVLMLEIPSQYSGKCYQIVKNNSKVLKEEWKPNGNWRVKTEVPAGFQQEFIDKLNAMVHGELIIEND